VQSGSQPRVLGERLRALVPDEGQGKPAKNAKAKDAKDAKASKLPEAA
jgi:chemotaxis protein MotA